MYGEQIVRSDGVPSSLSLPRDMNDAGMSDNDLLHLLPCQDRTHPTYLFLGMEGAAGALHSLAEMAGGAAGCRCPERILIRRCEQADTGLS